MTQRLFSNKARRLGQVLLAGVLLSGCIYRPNIQQGNLLEADAMADVEIGMSRSAVQFLLGTPTIADPFHADRWDYPSYRKNGRTEEVEQYWLVVWFEDDRVSRVERGLTLEPTL